jgi:hypothetical protein
MIELSTNEDSAAVKSNTFFSHQYKCQGDESDTNWLIKMALVYSYFKHKDGFKIKTVWESLKRAKGCIWMTNGVAGKYAIQNGVDHTWFTASML